MAVNEEYLTFIQDQLASFGEIESKRMFGGIGFFKEGIMFGMIGGNVLRLRVDDSNKADYEKHGVTKGLGASDTKKGMPYWEVPLSIIEDSDALLRWTEKAYAISLKAKKK